MARCALPSVSIYFPPTASASRDDQPPTCRQSSRPHRESSNHMPRQHPICNRYGSAPRCDRVALPGLENLEERLLLYSTLGEWTYSSRITYSFMPDGTTVGGVPSALFQKLNASFPTVSWAQQIEQAAALWENVANLNLALVS